MNNQKFKIAIVSDAIYPYNKGGKEKRIYELSTRLTKNGHDVHIYCMKWWKGEEKNRYENGVHLHAISKYYPLYSKQRRSISQALRFAFACLKLVKEDFDVLEVDHMPHFVLFSTKLVALLKRKKLYATWNEVWGKEYWNNYLGRVGNAAYMIEWLSARMPDVFNAVSEHTKQKLVSELKVKKEINVTPNGIDFKSIYQTKPAREKSDVIFAGRLLPHKNVDILVRSIKLLKQEFPDIKVFIIGDGPEKKRLENLIERLRLKKNIKLFGFLDKYSQVYSLFKSSKVFVFPSTREGFGIAALEANACGLPVITINHPDNAAKSFVINEKNGLLTDLDTQALAKSITYLLKNKKKGVIYNKFLQEFDWDKITRTIENIYKKDEYKINVELTKKSKLLLVTPYFHPKPGGLENYALNIAKGLQKYHDWDIVVVTSNHIENKFSKKNMSGIKIYRLPYLLKILNTPINPFWYFTIKNIIKQENPDIINAHAPVPFIADVTSSVSGTIPFILTYHAGTMKKEQFLSDIMIYLYEKIFLSRLLKRSNTIICSSKFVKNTITKEHRTKSVVITPAVNMSLFKPVEGKKKADSTILFVGSNAGMYKMKGLRYLIDAVTYIPNATLKVIGEKISVDKKNIKFIGIKKGKNLVKEIQKSTALVLPSVAQMESFGMVLIEAMACKTPVVGTNIGGIPEVINHKKDGFLVPSKNSEALKQALEKIIKDKNLAKTVAENGYKKVKDNYTWDKKVSQTQEVLKKYIISNS